MDQKKPPQTPHRKLSAEDTVPNLLYNLCDNIKEPEEKNQETEMTFKK
jgi:hypothetical protein